MEDINFNIKKISPTTIDLSIEEKQEFRQMYEQLEVTKEGVFKLDVDVVPKGSSGERRPSNIDVNQSNNVFKPEVYEKLKLKKQISSYVVEEIDKILYEIDYAQYGPAFDNLVQLIQFMERE